MRSETLFRWWTGRALRRQEAQLRGMSDRELADLGIGRSEIPAVLEAPAFEAAATSPGTGGRTGGSRPAFPAGRAAAGAACRLRPA
jgi:uncharacterized protein YjiS (DUF1127 family)